MAPILAPLLFAVSSFSVQVAPFAHATPLIASPKFGRRSRPVVPALSTASVVAPKDPDESVLARLRGGSGPLIGTLAYYVVGSVAYRFLEKWSLLDSLYFLTVTATTVGYGDIAPVTRIGRLFTSVYSLVGITVAFSSIVSLVEFMRNGDFRERLIKTLAMLPGVRQIFGGAFLSPDVDTDDASLSMRDVNLRISYTRRYTLCLLGPAIVFLFIALVAGLVHKLPPAACTYFGIITMSTIGYGDVRATLDTRAQPCAPEARPQSAHAHALSHTAVSAYELERRALSNAPSRACSLGRRRSSASSPPSCICLSASRRLPTRSPTLRRSARANRSARGTTRPLPMSSSSVRRCATGATRTRLSQRPKYCCRDSHTLILIAGPPSGTTTRLTNDAFPHCRTAV